MIATTYIITAKSTNVSLELKYDLNGKLIAFNLDGDYTEEQYNYLMDRTPREQEKVKERFPPNTKLQVKEMPADLSFEAFWEAYKYKVGKKKMAENIWNKLSRADKVKAMLYIPRYLNHLRLNPGLAQAYPTTYLNQEYYNQ